MPICCVVAAASAFNLGTDLKSVPSMPPPDSFNRGLAPPCIWSFLLRRQYRILVAFPSPPPWRTGEGRVRGAAPLLFHQQRLSRPFKSALFLYPQGAIK